MRDRLCTCMFCFRTFGYGGEPRGYYCSDDCARNEVQRQIAIDREAAP